MDVEGYETFKTFFNGDPEQTCETLLDRYDTLQMTDQEGVLQAEDAYVEVTDTTLTIHYDPAVLPENRDAKWRWAAHRAAQELEQDGDTYVDLDHMLTVDQGPAGQLLNQYNIDWMSDEASIEHDGTWYGENSF